MFNVYEERDILRKKIALIPVDARPVTYDLPIDLAQIAKWDIIAPPKKILGFLKEPAMFTELFHWLKSEAAHLDGLIVSIDMLLYGGLVPSRVNTDADDVIQARLTNLLRLKEMHPHLKIMAFSSTMRISNNDVNEEEKTYWKDYGKKIWSYSYHYHRMTLYEQQDDCDIVTDMERAIPESILKDYLQTRERHFNMNKQLVDLVKTSCIDFLVFPQDDTSAYGLNIMEQQQLQEIVNQNQLHGQILIYPGADEVSSVLAARMIYELEEEDFPTFYPIYSGVKGSQSIAMYEDRIIQESVKGQIFALGGHTVEGIQEADVIFGVNVPGDKQGDLALRLNLEGVATNNRNIGEWVNKLTYYHEQGKAIAIADVAYANGADEVMVPQLLSQFKLQDLIGFAAWNTAGNTLGTVVAQSALIHLARKHSRIDQTIITRQLLLRVLDDYVYQTHVRQKVRADIHDETDAEAVLKQVTDYFEQDMKAMESLLDLDIDIKELYLPWDRTFEIGIHLS